jgi:hypothetical protein
MGKQNTQTVVVINICLRGAGVPTPVAVVNDFDEAKQWCADHFSEMQDSYSMIGHDTWKWENCSGGGIFSGHDWEEGLDWWDGTCGSFYAQLVAFEVK